jgi:hypothetical protein
LLYPVGGVTSQFDRWAGGMQASEYSTFISALAEVVERHKSRLVARGAANPQTKAIQELETLLNSDLCDTESRGRRGLDREELAGDIDTFILRYCPNDIPRLPISHNKHFLRAFSLLRKRDDFRRAIIFSLRTEPQFQPATERAMDAQSSYSKSPNP